MPEATLFVERIRATLPFACAACGRPNSEPYRRVMSGPVAAQRRGEREPRIDLICLDCARRVAPVRRPRTGRSR